MVDLWCGSEENGNGGEGKTIEIRRNKKGRKKGATITNCVPKQLEIELFSLRYGSVIINMISHRGAGAYFFDNMNKPTNTFLGF